MNKKIGIIPQPQNLVEKKGVLVTDSKFVFKSDSYFSDYSNFLKQQIASCSVMLFPSNTKNDEAFCKIELRRDTTVATNPEEYFLTIDQDQVTITASEKTGALYAVQTLKQLILSNEGFLPCLTIHDYPEFKWRGFMLDTSRYFFTVDFIKKVLDAAAFHKMNRFHWHLTDDQGWRFNVPEYPNLLQTGSRREAHTMPLYEDTYNDFRRNKNHYYTDDEIKEVVKYAAKLNITIIPEVELPGHVSALLASYPEFGCTGGPYKVENRWGIFKDVLCLGNEKIYKIYTAVFKTIVRLFPGQYIHIGGDECLTERWKKCPKCQALKKELNLDSEAQLQSWVTKKMSEIVISLGKTPIGWDEVLDNTEKNPLPADVIVQSWRKTEGGKKAIAMNHFAIMSPVNKVYLNFKNYDSYEEPGRLSFTTAKKAYSFTPAEADVPAKARKLILGAECNLWTEDVPSSRVAEYMMFPRLCALSECMWLDREKKDFKRFKESIEIHKQRLSYMDLLYYNGKLE